MPASIIAPGVDYRLTDDDVLWTARAAAFEGGEAPDVLWTLTQRFVLRRATGRRESFTDFVREFSDPIDPDLARNGSICRPGGSGTGKWFCSDKALERRDVAQSIGWEGLQRLFPAATQATLLWANARLRNPVPRAVNFADQERTEAYLQKHPDSVIVAQRGNYFLAEGPSLGWTPDHVVLAADNGAMASASGTYAPSTGPRPMNNAVAVFFNKLIHPFPWG